MRSIVGTLLITLAAASALSAPTTRPTPVADAVATVLSRNRDNVEVRRERDGLVLHSAQAGFLESEAAFEVPLRADFVVKTDSTNIRLYYGPKGRVIFNWEVNVEQLRYHDPQDDVEKHQEQAGRVPVNKFVKLTWLIEESRSRLLVDGVERATIPGSYKGMMSRIGIGPANGSVITIRSVQVRGAHDTVADSTKSPNRGPARGDPPAATEAASNYVEPNVAAAPLSTAKLKLATTDRAQVALQIVSFVQATAKLDDDRSLTQASRMMAIAMLVAPNDRGVVLMNARLRRGDLPATRPAAPDTNALATNLLALADKASKTGSNDDKLLAAYLCALAMEIAPTQSDAEVQSELLRRDGFAADWDWVIGGGQTVQTADGGPSQYRAPDLNAPIFAPSKLTISPKQRHAIAEMLADRVARLSFDRPDAWRLASRMLGIALRCEASNRGATLLNATLRRGEPPPKIADATTQSSTSALMQIAQPCQQGSRDDQTLGAYLYGLIVQIEPQNEEALFQSERLAQQAGVKLNWTWADGTYSETPAIVPYDKEKTLARRQSTIKGLAVLTNESGQRSGITSDVIITAMPGNPTHAEPRFTRDVGEHMTTALDEAVRAIRMRYPRWQDVDIQISFEDKYSKQDGGSAGAAFATLLLSLLDGFEIDPRLAITGDITVDWRTRRIGGLDAKLRAAALDGLGFAVIPSENIESLDDYAVLYGASGFYPLQIIAADTLNDVVRIARRDRDAKLTEAISQFDELARQCVKRPTYVTTEEAKTKLDQILALAPNHLSAKYLRLAGDRKLPTHLSVSMSLYRMFVAVDPVEPVLWDGATPNKSVYTDAICSGVKQQLRELRRISHPSLSGLMSAMTDFVNATANVSTPNDRKTLDARRAAVLAEMNRLETRRETFEELRKGI